ncbi:hypothetical protein MBLNU13_g10308t1 [Cladosporium sp. NU13]
MDPLIITSGIIAVLQATKEVISYLKETKDAPKELTKVYEEARSLVILLYEFKDLVANHNHDSLEPWLRATSGLAVRGGLLDQYKKALEVLFGYDSSIAHIRQPSSQNSIFGHAENLLNALKNERWAADARKRPIIFIGHSLGGLVIKQALIRSSEYFHNGQDAKLGAIGQQTLGVVFLATPHRGSDAARLADVVCTAAKATWIGPNPHILDTLKSDSDVLESQRASFVSISQHMPLICIYEELRTKGQLIVPEHSAVMDGFLVKRNSIKANHIDVCKFDSREDDGYKKVIGFIRDIFEEGELLANAVPVEVDRRDVAAKRVKNLETIVQSSTSTGPGGGYGRS